MTRNSTKPAHVRDAAGVTFINSYSYSMKWYSYSTRLGSADEYEYRPCLSTSTKPHRRFDRLCLSTSTKLGIGRFGFDAPLASLARNLSTLEEFESLFTRPVEQNSGRPESA